MNISSSIFASSIFHSEPLSLMEIDRIEAFDDHHQFLFIETENGVALTVFEPAEPALLKAFSATP